jgi:hypothetical protein
MEDDSPGCDPDPVSTLPGEDDGVKSGVAATCARASSMGDPSSDTVPDLTDAGGQQAFAKGGGDDGTPPPVPSAPPRCVGPAGAASEEEDAGQLWAARPVNPAEGEQTLESGVLVPISAGCLSPGATLTICGTLRFTNPATPLYTKVGVLLRGGVWRDT